MNPKIPPLANPPATAKTLRQLCALLRAEGATHIPIATLEDALDLLEANGWVLPKPPIETPGP
jgi:hypothetical protein